MESLGEKYIELSTRNVPGGWSNHPDSLGVDTSFTRELVNEILPPSLYFTNPLPILSDSDSNYVFEEKGRGYFLWNDISGWVYEIKASTLEELLMILDAGGPCPSHLSRLQTIDEPDGNPTSNIPYSLNLDFVNRPDFTHRFSIPPKKATVFHGMHGCGKSELAIQYAHKIRDHLPDTWVFWLCATTKSRFDEDLAAIADLLPERLSPTVALDRRGYVLRWLRTWREEHWVLVIDDFRYSKVDFLSILEEPATSGNGSFIFTTSTSPGARSPPQSNDVLILEVASMRDDEAFRLMQKKLQPAFTDAGAHSLADGTKWIPLSIELAATSLKLDLISLSAMPKTSEISGLVQMLFDSVTPLSRSLLYFISFFNPPEIRTLWLLSYLEWLNDGQALELVMDDMELLTKHSLLTKIPNENAYKMHAAVQTWIIYQLISIGELLSVEATIDAFLESQSFVPTPDSSSFREVKIALVEVFVRRYMNTRDIGVEETSLRHRR